MKASSESGEWARTSVSFMRCLRISSRAIVARARRVKKTSEVKKKILDSCSKLSTIHSRRKKDGEAITSRFTLLTETPGSFEIDRRRNFLVFSAVDRSGKREVPSFEGRPT